MKIIIFPSHPIINEILKLQKMNLLEMKNTTISPKNSTTKTNYTIEVFKKTKDFKLCKFKAIKRVAVKFDYIYIYKVNFYLLFRAGLFLSFSFFKNP